MVLFFWGFFFYRTFTLFPQIKSSFSSFQKNKRRSSFLQLRSGAGSVGLWRSARLGSLDVQRDDHPSCMTQDWDTGDRVMRVICWGSCDQKCPPLICLCVCVCVFQLPWGGPPPETCTATSVWSWTTDGPGHEKETGNVQLAPFSSWHRGLKTMRRFESSRKSRCMDVCICK